jgi:uncharacterized membrane protein YgcG
MPLLSLSPARRRGRRAEKLIRTYEFPQHVRRKLERESPGVEWEPVERALREWLVCCAYRGRFPLAMPSRAVDYAWHAFILDTAAYRDFCDKAYGRFLDHFPEDSGNGPTPSFYETVWAWDRSAWSDEGEATLWTLDHDQDLEDPWGVGAEELADARRSPERGAGARDWTGWGAGGCGGGSGDGGSATSCGGGGGCGGGGCGGGGG